MTSIIVFYSIEGQTKSKWKCVREDGRDLVEEWKNNKKVFLGKSFDTPKK